MEFWEINVIDSETNKTIKTYHTVGESRPEVDYKFEKYLEQFYTIESMTLGDTIDFYITNYKTEQDIHYFSKRIFFDINGDSIPKHSIGDIVICEEFKDKNNKWKSPSYYDPYIIDGIIAITTNELGYFKNWRYVGVNFETGEEKEFKDIQVLSLEQAKESINERVLLAKEKANQYKNILQEKDF